MPIKPLRTPFNALLSYFYFANQAADIRRWHAAGIRFIGDSGAFSAHTLGKDVTVDGFAGWLDAVGPCLDWAASLDVINDPVATWRNYRELKRAGYPVVPTIHCGTPVAELDRYVDQGADFVGLGGIASRRDKTSVMRWLVAMFRYQRDHHPEVRFHGWGLTGRDYLMSLPFWSVDSSGFTSLYRYGRINILNMETGRMVTYHLDGKGAVAAHGRELRDRLGITPVEIAKAGVHNRALLYGVGAHLAQDLELFYQRRHKVTPPPSLAKQTDQLGTRAHLATTAHGFFPTISFDVGVGTRVVYTENTRDPFDKLLGILPKPTDPPADPAE